MTDKAHRKELLAEYKQNHPEAGVYRIVNRRNGKALFGSSANLASIRSRVAFAKSQGSLSLPGKPSAQLRDDLRRYGIDAFELEVLEVLETKPEMTHAEVLADLGALEELWREKLDPSTLY